MVKLFSLKSPDEWATTKQACRDTYVVTCFLPSTIRIYIYIYNLHELSCQEKVSRFSMLPISCNGTPLAVSQRKLRMVLMVGYPSSRLNQNKPFSGPVSTLLSSSAEFYSFSLSSRLRLPGQKNIFSMAKS